MLTVFFATRNRARILRNVLESYTQLLVPESGWKVVVIDNGSTDDTQQVLDSFASRLPLEFLVEPTPGKNAALNRGLGLLEGDLAVFTDDDAFPRRDWLVQLRNAADAQPEYSLFGGAIIPRWEVPPPAWVQWMDLGPIFTITNPGLSGGPVAPDDVAIVQGPNMAIRASIFASGTRFDATIGPCGTDYAMGSETELLLRLSAQGHKAWHVPEAVVEHFVRQEQLNEDWVLRRAIRWGRGRHRMAPYVAQWFGIPRHVFRDLPAAALAVAGASLAMDRKRLFQARWNLNILLGKLKEARLMARERQGKAAQEIASKFT